MFTVIAGANVFKGVLKNYEWAGEDMLIRFCLSDMRNIDLTLPKVPPMIGTTMQNLGLQKLKNAIVNFNDGTVTLESTIQSDGNSVNEGKKNDLNTHRPKMTLGGSSLVG